MRGKRQGDEGELPTTNQSTGRGQEKREEQREGLLAARLTGGNSKQDPALPETNGHLPFGGQETYAQQPGLQGQ